MEQNEAQVYTPIQVKNDSENLNNFTILRTIAATFVVITRSYGLTGNGKNQPILGDIGFGTLGVFIFFILSGYLIVKSWEYNPSFIQFFWKSR